MAKINPAVQEKLEQIRSNVLMINRVPPKTFSQFKQISKDSCDDYGLTLKMLIDYWMDNKQNNLIYDLMNKRVSDLEKFMFSVVEKESKPKVSHSARQGLKVTNR